MSAHFSESESRNEALAARAEVAAHLGSWELDLLTGQQTWSDNLYRLMGYDVGEVEPTLQSVFNLGTREKGET